MRSGVAPVGFLSLAVAAFLVAGYLLLPACALAHFGGVWDPSCPSEPDPSRDAERAALLRESEETQRRIAQLEMRLAAQLCEGEHPDVPIVPDGRDGRDRAELLPPPGEDDRSPDSFADALPEAPRPPDVDEPVPDTEEDREAMPDAPRDLADLEGCWDLESELEFRLRGAEGGTQPFPEWSLCFEEGSGGNGTQVMRSAEGMLCEGAIRGAFDATGALVLTEDGDLLCADGTEIFQRVTTCAMGDGGLAVCESVQPRTGGRGNFTLRRN